MKAKKFLIGVFIISGLVLASIIIVPIIFKDEIQQAIDEQLEANVNADILYDIDNFSLSLISNFPNLTIGVAELGVIGRDQFEGEVLFAIEGFEAEVNLWKLLFDGETRIQGIYLTDPQIFIKVLEDGSANYDIAVASEQVAPEEETETSDFNLAIDRWEITNGHIIYDDATIPTYVELESLNHSGSGNFSLAVFDLETNSSAHLTRISYDGTDYLSNRELNMAMTINMDLDKMKFVFMENNLAINDFNVGFDGWIEMPNDDIDMDLTVQSQNNSFKSLISIIPALYLTDFDQLESSGNLQFNAAIAGTYNDTSMPAFNVNLIVNDGMFHYPDLPEAVSNVEVKMLIDNKDGNIDNTLIDISRFHMEFGNNPVDASLKIANLITYPIDLKATAKLNMSEMMQMFPMEGMELKGLLDANLEVVGIYDTVTSTIPARGSFNLSDFYYADEEYLPQGMSISTAVASFNPESISLEAFESKVGQSDFSATGKLNNYLNYVLVPDEVLTGQLNLFSDNILIDEFMTETETEEEIVEADKEVANEEVYDLAIPANLDFIMNANLKRIEYDGLILTDAKGVIAIKEGILDMDNLSTKTLGGEIVFNGIYNTKEPSDPKFDMDLGINSISIRESFDAFNTVQKFAPIAENLEGELSTNFKLAGDLDTELMPITKTVNGNALLKINKATLKGGNFATGLSKFISKEGKEEMTLEDMIMDVTITNGVVAVKPFNLIIEGYKANISGGTALDGELNYKIATSVPAGKIGQQANAALAKLTGSTQEPSSEIKLNLGVTGQYDSPKISLMSSDTKDQVKNSAVNKAADIVKENTGVDIPTSKEELNKEAREKARKEADKLLADAQKQADQVKAEAKNAADKLRAEAKVQNDNLIKEAGSNPFKVKAAEIAGKKLIDEADKNAKKIEEEGNKQADAIMLKAREKADALIQDAEGK